MSGDLSRRIEILGARTPDQPAIRFDGDAITYRAFAARIRSAAVRLAAGTGLARGDRVAYLGFNTPEMLVLLFACARLGTMLLPLNWRLTLSEQTAILADAEPALLIADPAHQERAQALADACPGCRLFDFDGLAGDGGAPAPEAAGTAADPLLLVYTSGTTGKPKGAVLTQRAIHCNALNSIHMHDLTHADIVLTALPMFHVGGLNIQTTPALIAGATVILHRSFDPGAVLASITGDRPSLLVLVPATIAALQAHPDWAAADLASLRAVTTGSTIVPLSLIEAVHQRNVPVVQVYGLTESGPIAVCQRIPDAMRTIGSTGQAALHSEVRIVDERGRDLPPGEAGELWLRGDNLFAGYWRDPDSTAAAFADGWLRTGDIGERGAHGSIVLRDRKTDMLVSGGENVYPAEIEQAIDRIDGVAEVAVIGRADGRWGETPVAVIVPATGARLTRTGILAALQDRLARFKHPRDIVFVGALPRNAMGKVQKHILRQRYDPCSGRG